MIIQSKRIWVVNTWLAAQVEVEEGKIVNIYPYGEKEVDEDYGDKAIVVLDLSMYTHMVLMDLIQMMRMKKVFVTG